MATSPRITRRNMFAAFATRIARTPPAAPVTPTSSLRAFGSSLLGTANMSAPTSGGALEIGIVPAGNYDYIVKQGNQTISSFTAADWFTSTQDTNSAWIVINGNLTINSGITVIPSVRKLFTVVYVQGNLVLNGTISMSLRGANHSGTGASGGAVTANPIRIATGTFSGVSDPTISAEGGAGGAAVTAAISRGNNGTSAGSTIRTGGGASGDKGVNNTANPTWGSGAGAAGTCFSGGSSGGGFSDFQQTATGPASPGGNNGGAGGAGSSATGQAADGGVGNPSPTRIKASSTADNGTGGVLVVIVSGTVTGTGTLSAVGGSQATLLTGVELQSGFGGGGSGGGLVVLMAQSASGPTLTAAGGTSARNDNNGNVTFGGAGGAGYTGTLIIP